ncbi:MAG TPA: S24/S26 family peptidase [Thermoanaerobaculia bacterium]|nr:S24/S26 family peptidase [Thermoanaerobaculia bacterium]
MIDAATVIEEVLATGNAARFRARGDSMHPSIRSDELLEVERVDPSSVRRGDVVLARLSRGLTAHRVVRVSRDGRFITRGDNAPMDDEPFFAGAIIGRVRTPRRSPVWFAMRRALRALRR